MKIDKLTVTMSSGPYHETIPINVPNDTYILDLDFNGSMMVGEFHQIQHFIIIYPSLVRLNNEPNTRRMTNDVAKLTDKITI